MNLIEWRADGADNENLPTLMFQIMTCVNVGLEWS
jgi:hypothetical protein